MASGPRRAASSRRYEAIRLWRAVRSDRSDTTRRYPGEASPAITRGELEAHVAHLADDVLAGGAPGRPGAERAARYVVRAFQTAGLEAPSSHPAYLQTFDFAVGVELGRENRLILQHGDRRITVFELGRDFLPLAGSLADRIVQPVVFAGYGISAPEVGYDDYAGVDVRGRVVMVLRYGPEGDDPAGRFGGFLSERYKAATAAARGISGTTSNRLPASPSSAPSFPARVNPNRTATLARPARPPARPCRRRRR